KASELLIAHARAFFELVDPGQRAQWRKRRGVSSEKKARAPAEPVSNPVKPSAEEAERHFEEGTRQLDVGNLWGAIESFQAAAKIEPKAVYRAYLAWSRFQLNPKLHAESAIQELTAAAKVSPKTDPIHFFLGEIFRLRGDWNNALECY